MAALPIRRYVGRRRDPGIYESGALRARSELLLELFSPPLFPGIGDLAWMHFAEKETTVLLHIPPEAITKATLHDERGRVIRTHRASKSDPTPK